MSHKDPKIHPTKLINNKSSTRKSLLTQLDKLINYHKSQHQIQNFQNAFPKDTTDNSNQASTNYASTNYTSTTYASTNYTSTNFASTNYASTNYASTNYTSTNYSNNNNSPDNNNTSPENNKTDKNRKSGTVSNPQASSRNLVKVATNIKPNPRPTENPVVPHALLANIYHFMAMSWLSANAPKEMAMFKAQPHLLNNIQDAEAAKRLRSVLHESPIYGRKTYKLSTKANLVPAPQHASIWLDLVDLQFLRNHYVANFAKQYPDTFGEAVDIPAKPAIRPRNIDLVDAFKNAPPALITRPLVVPISLQNRELEFTLKKTISNTGFIAHKYMDRLGLHATLDKHYLDLLPALYTSNPQTLQNDKACSAKCTGMASFSIQASPTIMDERILSAIKQNREQILPYIENPEVSTELCANIIFLQCMEKKFVAYFSTHPKDSAEKTKLVDAVIEIFFHLVETCDERAMLIFPPAKTSLRPIIKDLAEILRSLHPQFSVRFLGSIVANFDRVLWLHPYWIPAYSSFDELCDIITKFFLRAPHTETERLVMPLLHKFDFVQWLQVGPTTAQVRKVITILGNSIAAQNGAKFGPQLTQNPGWMFLHQAFKLTCGHKLFDGYIDILNMLLNYSRTIAIPPEVWWGFLDLPLSTTLSDTQIMATFEILTKFFWELRAPKQNQTANLYTAFFPYIPPFVEFTKKLMGSHFTSTNPLFVGNGILEVYEPWVARADPSSQLPPSDIFPWVNLQAAEAHLVVSGLVECLSLLVDIYPQTFDNFMGYFLSKMAPYRTPEILSFQWYKWIISPTSLMLLLNSIQAATPPVLVEGQPIPLSLPFLLCEIIAMIDWTTALSRAENPLDFVVNFLRLVIFSVHQHPNPFDAKFGLFLKQIHTFNWFVLPSESYEHIIGDFLALVQKHHSSLQNFSASKGPQSRAIEIQKWGFLLHLLRSVAYVDLKTQDAQQILSISEKFCSYVQVVVYLLGLPNFDYWKGNDPLGALRDIMGTMKVRFKLLVQIPEGSACISKTLRTFLAINNLPVASERLRDSSSVSCELLREVPYLSIEFLRAAHQTIFSVHALALLVENSLEVYFGLFAPPGPPCETLSVPELENKEFLGECIKFGYTYTLYIYCLQQLTRHAPLKILCSSVWEWECNIPVETLGEKCYKMLPLWAKSASLIYYLFRETNDKRLIEQINTLALKIHKFGEDKKTDGFFGAIGFGGRSTFSTAFRFIAKAFSVFLTLQAHPADNTLAFRASHQPLRALGQFVKTHPHLAQTHAFVTSGASRDREYAATPGMTQALVCVARFIGDGAKTMENVEEFVGGLGEALYPNAKIFVHMKGA